MNHHGKTIKVGPDGKPIHGDEQGEDDKSINSSEVLFSRYKQGVSIVILDGNSEIGAHLCSVIGISICSDRRSKKT